MKGYGCRGGSASCSALSRWRWRASTPSIATFFGVHSGLAMGSIYLGGSEEQKQKWLPPMARLEKIGCFGLTEPLVGSGHRGGLTTTAKRDGDTWILNGQKKWIGNSPWCDVSIIWARDVADNQVKGFIIENKTTPGFSVEKIQNKISLKVVQNGLITMKNCPRAGGKPSAGGQLVPRHGKCAANDALYGRLGGDRLRNGRLRTRAANTARSACSSAGRSRSFQLVQDLLARMLANITASQCMIVAAGADRGRRQADGRTCGARQGVRTSKCRETVAWARELLGGNGISADYNVARFFADAEALYSYEGTFQMQNLIVGKAITGFQRIRLNAARRSRTISHECNSNGNAGRNSADARECPVREERRHCVHDCQSSQGSECSERKDVGRPANGVRTGTATMPKCAASF